MKVLIVEPGKYPREADIEHTLEAEQAVVGGTIEAVYPWRDRACIVCNDNGIAENLPLLLDAADLHLQTLAQLGINGAQRLIQQQNFWPGDDGAGQCHTLLLAAGKLGRVGVGLVLQAHHGQSFGDTVVDLGLA